MISRGLGRHSGGVRRVVWLLGAALVAGCVKLQPAPALADAETAPALYRPQVEQEYRIEIGDRLAVRSYGSPGLNQDLVVRPDGRVSLLLIGELAVRGLSIAQLQAVIARHYASDRLGEPDVTVALTSSPSLSVYVGGEVARPSAFEMAAPLTLLQAVTRVGGFLDSADRHQVLVLRRDREGVVHATKLDASGVLRGTSPDLYLRRHDIVYVPKSAIADVGVFVEQYINQLIPSSVLLNFGFTHSFDDSSVQPSIVVRP